MDNSFERDILNSAEAAEYLRVTPHTLAIWRSEKRYDLPFAKVGRFVRYRKEDLRRFIDEHLQTRQPN
jgi:excisionase family DNA binding protein